MKKSLGLTALALGMSLACVSPALATTSFTLHSVQGHDAMVDVSIDNFTSNIANGVKITLDVTQPDYADLRSVYFNVNDESLLNNLYAAGWGVTGQQVDANNVFGTNTFLGNDIIGVVSNTYGGFDAGVNIGTPTAILDDISSLTFYVVSSAGDITENDFANTAFAVHAGSVGNGSRWYQRLSTSDLAGIVPGEYDPSGSQSNPQQPPASAPTPEPATAAMGLLGLAALAAGTRRRKRCL